MKCDHCKKKTHLEFKCACGQKCCVVCRTPEVHGCTEKYGVKVVLEKVVAEKVQKI
jgi:hypothetical protein